MISSLVTDPQALPAAAEPERARLGLERWREAVSNHSDSATRRYARALSEDRAGNALLQAIFGNSPFLTACLLKDLNFTRLVITDGVDAAYRLALTSVTAPDVPPRSLDELMSRLRLARMRVALTVALADICGVWGLKTVTTALSRFADACLNACVGHLLPEAATQGAFSLRHPDEPERGSGLVLLGVGKLGASELNYSSDIDLIVLYDGERIETQDPDGLQRTFVRLTRRLVRALEERTADGYVFRTDLRLRPDPGATPVCMSVLAAETYYESLGQNWERAAMIKARPAAGDYAAGVSFLANLRPFIWRKHLDFAAIQDIHSIKRQIHAHKGGGTIAIEGHNIKLGRGGIREIEFFAQTQQL
ncbi:MAG: glutamine-synthetase adenylyltransferase, partial [Alphaproteobacteria bacterium]